ncbi:PREDICTED: hexosaminidase D-like [Nicrophorus vespilloides]|uniref:beta-N-acetylhexosaminidase n=1 Tax=Nicrophorus vespilloides TaxID=110193 RepID=A0ABM1ML11_NICVS|nr:PREDICTED: hexosaminidase D-like [Nicrophorus vespilloides]
MNNYTQRLLLTVWRKKTTLLVAGLLITIILFGLQYSSRLQQNRNGSAEEADRRNGMVFVEKTTKANEVSLERVHRRKQSREDQNEEEERKDVEEKLGIPNVNLDGQNPYVPKRRIVHFDLKGAPPKIDYIKRILPLIKNLGATGILIEYEDMFPYDGSLKHLAAKNAYSKKQILEIQRAADELKLTVIPLIQTFGHVEFALKHREFIKIREVLTSPQALCPSKNLSLDFISEMISQVLELHPKSKYLHIGCDEVFQMGECELCRLELHDNLFLRHVQNVANLVMEKRAGIKVIIWDDMLRHLSSQTMLDIQLGRLVEPMVWVYAEDIYRFVQPQVWEKYAAVFKTAWTASAFKGAFGETLYVPDARRHLENNLRWLDVMAQQERNFKDGFSGIVLTGWQRYDHFAVLCELLPAAIPSLALSLLAVSHGYFNSSLKSQFIGSLSCPQHTNRHSPFINLLGDPFLWDKLGRCMFPGSPFFRLIYRLNTVELEAQDYLRTTTRNKGWLTEYNLRRNYSLPLRIEELTSDLPRIYHGVVSIARSAFDAMNSIFDNYTISEWIEQRIYPYVLQLERLQNQSNAIKNVNVWPVRPLSPLKDLQRLGVPIIVP